MKIQEIIKQGVCGMQIILNVFDQYAVTLLVDAYDRYMKAKEAHKKWEAGLCDEDLRIETDDEGNKIERWKRYDRNAYREIYPEPEVPSFNHDENMKTVMVFLRKLTIPCDDKPTIFDEDEEVQS